MIECFVAEGPLLIFTCTKIHSAGNCPAEGLVSREALAWVGRAVASFFAQRKGAPSPLSDGRLGNEKRKGKKKKGVELEWNVARKKGANDSEGIEAFHSWPVCYYV